MRKQRTQRFDDFPEARKIVEAGAASKPINQLDENKRKSYD